VDILSLFQKKKSKPSLNKYIYIFCILTILVAPLNAQVKTTLILENKAQAIEYLPKNFSPKKKYPLIIALHGMGQTSNSAFQKWKPVADNLNAILLCPKGSNFTQGYTRTPIDDRKTFVDLYNTMKKKYQINESESILAGFSRGGNFAIETGILYPETFKNIICIFGFFNKGIEKKITQKDYSSSNFYSITGNGDFTQDSLNFGKTQFDKHKIRNYLKTYSTINHDYPPNFLSTIKKVKKWFDE
jgi:predicted esterase